MQDLTAALTFGIAGYAAAYMLLRPSALADALSTGPGMGRAGWAFHHKHYKLTYPVMGLLFVILALSIADAANT